VSKSNQRISILLPYVLLAVATIISCQDPSSKREEFAAGNAAGIAKDTIVKQNPVKEYSSKVGTIADDGLYYSPNRDFLIQFPAEPQRSTEVAHLEEDDIQLVIEMFTYEVDSVTAYWLSYTDYPPDIVDEDPISFLQQKMGLIADNVGGDSEISNDHALSLKGHPGLAFSLSNSETFFGMYNLFLVEDRLYQISILKLYRPPSEAEATYFLKSFDLI
jgi:hypothetical protein